MNFIRKIEEIRYVPNSSNGYIVESLAGEILEQGLLIRAEGV
jgi:hypothetical protein